MASLLLLGLCDFVRGGVAKFLPHGVRILTVRIILRFDLVNLCVKKQKHHLKQGYSSYTLCVSLMRKCLLPFTSF